MNASDDNVEITLGLLNAVHEDSSVTQRRIASELGVALGLVNAYLTRCVKEGYIKIRHVPANRYAYYLTPAGFAEKSRLTARYLSQSFNFFRNARRQGSEILESCERKGFRRVALVGASDLAEIMALCAQDQAVRLVGVVDTERAGGTFAGLPVADVLKKLGPVDAVVVTDLADPQGTYATLAAHLPDERILAPGILSVTRNGRIRDGARP